MVIFGFGLGFSQMFDFTIQMQSRQWTWGGGRGSMPFLPECLIVQFCLVYIFFFHVGFQSLNNKMRETERFKIFLPLPTILGCTQVRIIMIIKLHFLIECPAFNWPQESSRSTKCPRCATSPGEKTFFFVLLSYLMHTGVKLPFAKVRRQLPHNRDR